jgi:hypothetical protein
MLCLLRVGTRKVLECSGFPFFSRSEMQCETYLNWKFQSTSLRDGVKGRTEYFFDGILFLVVQKLTYIAYLGKTK